MAESSFASILIFISTIGISIYAMYQNHSLYNSWALSPFNIVHYKKYYQVITSGFIHADWMHLLFNMLSFYFFAFRLEGSIGAFNFFVIYFLSMIAGNLSTIFKYKNDPYYRSIGASGAVSGIIFSSILFAPTAKMMMFPIPIPFPAWLFAILYLVWSHFAAQKSDEMINHSAHLYGAIAGLIVTILIIPGSFQFFLNQLFG